MDIDTGAQEIAAWRSACEKQIGAREHDPAAAARLVSEIRRIAAVLLLEYRARSERAEIEKDAEA